MDGGTEAQSRVIETGARRSLRIRPCFEGEAVQLEVLSTRGNSLEAVTLDEGQLLGLIGALREAQAEAQDSLLDALKRKEEQAKESYKKALASNPWLNGEREAEKNARYIRRAR